MKKIIGLFLLVYSANLSAQNNAVSFAEIITPQSLKEKLSVIAGAGMEGRETATEGQRKAAAFIENYFRQLKLQPGDSGKYQMAFPVYQDSLTQAAFNINKTTFKMGEDFAVANNAIVAGNWNINAIVFAGKGTRDSANNDFDKLDINGNWIMIDPQSANELSARQVNQKIALMPMYNAKGLLIVSNNFPRNNYAAKGRMYNTLSGNTLPVVFISKKIAEKILNTTLTGSNERKSYKTDISISIHKATNNLQSTDVIGVLPGTDKKSEYIFITAHYDHLGKHDSLIYYGADDDGSGTTSVLQIATAFAAARDKGILPHRTIIFMTVSGEEKGLWGSEYFTNHPTVSLDSASVDLNIDMVGRIDPERKYGDSTNYVYTIGDDKLSSDLMKLSDSINNACCRLELDRKFNDPKDPNRFYYRSDHYNFASKGVPIIFYFNGTHADYHKPTDTVDKINFDVMAKRVKLVFYTAWEMANRDALLKRDIPLTQQ